MKKILSSIILMFGISSAESLFHDSEYFYVNKHLQISNYIEQAKTLTLSNIFCGSYHCYALKDGTVWSVGFNSYGQLGLGDTTNRTTWTNTGFTADSVLAYGNYSYALKGGTVWSVGSNDRGQLGLGDTTDRRNWTNTEVEADSVAAGTYHGYALKGGTVWSVGYNGGGQLGLGDNTNRSTFTEVPFTLD